MATMTGSNHQRLAVSSRHGLSLRILVTGAAGLIGGELCGHLAERGHAVVALIHRTRVLRRNDGGVIEPALYPGAGVEAGTVIAIEGDVCKRRLGLQPKVAAMLASNVDLIVHCAAETGFEPAADLYQSVNVHGTTNVISFARCAKESPPALVHVSTAYVSGERSGRIPEDELNPRPVFANHYEATKAQSESVVRASSLRAAIARPSIVVGASETGAIGRFKNIYTLLKLIGSGRVTVLPTMPEASLDLVPIDFVINGLTDLIERFEYAVGSNFHLASGYPLSITELVTLDYPGFHVPRLACAETFDPSSLDPFEAMIYENVTSLYAPYLRRNPHFETGNLRALSERTCPPTGPKFLRRIVDFAVSAGYLRPGLSVSSKSGSIT
jgi:2-alkyl-3-oxoalkanoate reductase